MTEYYRFQRVAKVVQVCDKNSVFIVLDNFLTKMNILLGNLVTAKNEKNNNKKQVKHNKCSIHNVNLR
jgi:hypothetical protein